MVEFPAQVKDSAAKAYKEWAEAEGLSEDERRSKFGRAVRVSARYLPELRKEVRSGDLVWYSDQPKIGGGKGEHPGALQHFVAGLPLCQLTHYAERASVWGMKIQDLEVSVTGRFMGMSGRGFDSIEYEVRVTSQEPADKIKELASAAASDCYVTNTLKRSCKVIGKIFLNGESLMELEH
ncbi:MAG: OsmC family protein [Nitrososphaerota archaeon]|nr:OsmC family protein [Nitrososphaerota archaeon]MDG6917990.1 OsmC family protein [Nitrososphaerota archaeon]